MSSRRERALAKLLLVLFCFFLGAKGWVLVALMSRAEGSRFSGTAAAEPALEQEPAVVEGPGDCGPRISGLLSKIREEDTRLAQREMRLQEREETLEIYKQEVATRIQELVRLRQQVEAVYRQIQQAVSEKEQRLVKIYDAMEPESAARRLELMDDAIGSWLLLKMNVRKAGQILGLMDTKKASRITKRIRGEDPRSADRIEQSLKEHRQKVAPATKVKGARKKKTLKVSRTRPGPKDQARVLQVAAFRERSRADRVVKDLQDKGYPSFSTTMERGNSNKTYHRVFVGPFNDPAQAARVKARLESKEGYRGILIRAGSPAGA